MTIYTFLEYFLVFLLYSFIGWSAEVVLSLIQHKRFINRGFLIGPYCPIYGFGCILIVLLLQKYMENPLVLFILAMVICMILEYVTSYLMELIFKARWWDYSDKKFNINGRVCLETAIPFGIGGALIMYIVHPFVISLVDKLSSMMLLLLGSLLFVAFIIDNIMSFDTIFKIKGVDYKDYMDNTEEITRKVKEYLIKHSVLTKRLVNAFPDARMKVEKYKKQLKK